MDSCNLFNFLFGTKKATSELSKCFSGLSQQRCQASKLGQDRSARTTTPPPSPLRQLQMRLVSLTNRRDRRPAAPGTQSCHCDASCNAAAAGQLCGTYRATLVHSLPAETDELDDIQDDKDELIGIDIVGNLSMPMEQEDSLSVRSDNRSLERQPAESQTAKPKRLVLYSDFAEYLESAPQANEYLTAKADCRNSEHTDQKAADKSDKLGPQEETNPRGKPHDERVMPEASCDKTVADKRNDYVRNLVRSFESSSSFKTSSAAADNQVAGIDKEKPFNHAPCSQPVAKLSSKPKPPKTPPKTNKAKLLNWQLNLNKPTEISQLFRDEKFLTKFFYILDPLDRCLAAQVCRQWRNILYADSRYWKDLIIVIDCTQLRREHLIECILTTLQSGKWKQQCNSEHRLLKSSRSGKNHESFHTSPNTFKRFDSDIADLQRRHQCGPESILEIDQEDVWRIQELCNRFSQRTSVRQQHQHQHQVDDTTVSQQHEPTTTTTSKSSSIPSQISSTLSSVSICSLLSPLSESSRVESMREKLYSSLAERAFQGICLFGASDDDIEDFVAKFPADGRDRLLIARLNNCSLSNNALDLFTSTFKHLEEIELSGCNELTNAIDLSMLSHLKRLTITDCFNMADGLAQRLVSLLYKLDELVIQAYHLTDAFLEFLANNGDTCALKKLELPNCKELTNQSLVIMAKHFPDLRALSISGSTKICDEGLEYFTEHAQSLQILNLSWCTKITDISLERIASDLGETLTDLILDRNINITNMGLGFLTKMNKLALLHIRWCSRISDTGLEAVINIKSLRYLSLAGLHQITAGGLFYLIDTNLHEVELTNCPAANGDLLMFLSSKMPNCNIIY